MDFTKVESLAKFSALAAANRLLSEYQKALLVVIGALDASHTTCRHLQTAATLCCWNKFSDVFYEWFWDAAKLQEVANQFVNINSFYLPESEPVHVNLSELRYRIAMVRVEVENSLCFSNWHLLNALKTEDVTFASESCYALSEVLVTVQDKLTFLGLSLKLDPNNSNSLRTTALLLTQSFGKERTSNITFEQALFSLGVVNNADPKQVLGLIKRWLQLPVQQSAQTCFETGQILLSKQKYIGDELTIWALKCMIWAAQGQNWEAIFYSKIWMEFPFFRSLPAEFKTKYSKACTELPALCPKLLAVEQNLKAVLSMASPLTLSDQLSPELSLAVCELKILGHPLYTQSVALQVCKDRLLQVILETRSSHAALLLSANFWEGVGTEQWAHDRALMLMATDFEENVVACGVLYSYSPLEFEWLELYLLDLNCFFSWSSLTDESTATQCANSDNIQAAIWLFWSSYQESAPPAFLAKLAAYGYKHAVDALEIWKSCLSSTDKELLSRAAQNLLNPFQSCLMSSPVTKVLCLDQ